MCAILCAGVLGTKYKSLCVFSFLVFISFVATCVVLVFLSNMSNPSALGVLNVSAFLLTLCQYCLPIKGIFWLMILMSYVSDCVHAIIHYYRTEVFSNFLAWKHHFNFRYLIASCIWILIGITGSCGAGLPLVLALRSCRRIHLNLVVQKYSFKIPHITLPLGEQPIQQINMVHDCNPGICTPQKKVKRPRNVGKHML